MYFHLLSDCILLLSVGFVIRNCFNFIDLSQRVFWSSFLFPIALGALIDILQVTFQTDYTFLSQLLQKTIAVVGSIGIVAGTWNLLLQPYVKLPVAITIMIAAFVLLLVILSFQSGIMAIIFQPFCIIFALMMASWGLINRRKSALWLVIAFMILAVSLKEFVIQIPSSAIEVQHYLLALSIILIGYAIRSRNLLLFK